LSKPPPAGRVTDRPVVAVVGAAARQGCGLADAVLGNPQPMFRLRVVTRAPGSPEVLALQARGAEIVVADPDDEPALTRALSGAHAVFRAASLGGTVALPRARCLTDAARAAGVQHVVWTTFHDVRTDGGIVDALLSGVPATVLRPGPTWERLLRAGLRAAGPDLTLTLPLGAARLPGIAAADVGRCAYGVLLGGAALVGVDLGVAGEHVTGAQLAAALAARWNGRVTYVPGPGPSDARPSDARLLAVVGDAAADADDYCRTHPVSTSRRLNPALLDLAGWVAATGAPVGR
jgi:uncharacterized protein YbjT (DUF2867 family)